MKMARTAQALAPRLGLTHYSAALALSLRRKYPEALHAVDTALRCDSSVPMSP